MDDLTGFCIRDASGVMGAAEPRPEARQGHVMLRITPECVLLFGGRGSSIRDTYGRSRGRRYLNDTWLLHGGPSAAFDVDEGHNDDNFQWERLECEEPVPSPRWSCAAAVVENETIGTVVLHGGRGDQFCDDLCSLSSLLDRGKISLPRVSCRRR